MNPTDDSTLQPAMHPALELLQSGGPVVAILLVLSVAALAIVLAKLWQFRRLGDARTAEALLRHRAGETDAALSLAKSLADPAAQVLARALRGIRRGLPEARVRDEVESFALATLDELRGGLRALEVIAGLAPLLGLFGTVLGMIDAFQQLEQAGSQVDPSILSGGIWEALLTTAVGLAVAIPAVAALNLLERQVERTALAMEAMATRPFTDDLSADQEQGHAGSARLATAGIGG